jgi:hypothetical protein
LPKFISNITMANNSKVTGLPAPSDSSDAATKAYVDSKAAPVTSVNTKTGAVVLSAADIAVADTAEHFTNTNVETVLAELKQFANSGKNSIAGVIGSPAASSDTFAQLTERIQTAKNALATLINRAEGTAIVNSGNATQALSVLTEKLPDVRAFKQSVKLGKKAGSTHIITLSKAITEDKLCVTPYVLIYDTTTTEFFSSFNNGDSSNFIFNTSHVEFSGGVMQLKTSTNTATDNAPINNVQSYTFNLADVSDFRITTMANSQVTFETIPTGQVIRAVGDIDVSDVSFISYLLINKTETGNGKMRLAISVDGGSIYKAWNGSAWIEVYNVSNPGASTFGTNGMTETVAENLAVSEFEQLLGTSTDLRFAYYLERPTFADNVNISSIQLNGSLNGVFMPAVGSVAFVQYEFLSGTNQLRFTFSENDTYKINWIDT